jgi:hypothetical protein
MLRACSSVPPSGTARIIREHALGSLRKALGDVREIVGSEARARQVRRMRGAGAFARACVGASEL